LMEENSCSLEKEKKRKEKKKEKKNSHKTELWTNNETAIQN
jgi:hypothetical protein